MDDFGMGYALGQDSGSSCRDGGSGMWGGDGSWIFAFLIIALIFGGRGGLFGGGWGGNSGGYGDGINSPAGQGALTRGDLCSEFNFNNLDNAVRGIQQGLCDGFYAMNSSLMNGFHGVDNAICNLGYQTQQGFNTLGSQMAQCCCDTQRAIDNVNFTTLQGFNGIQNQISSCCCDTQRQIERGFCDVGYNMATNTNNIIQSSHNDTDRVIAKLDSMENARQQEKIAALQLENQGLKFQASQSTQNAFITANQEAQTAELIRRINPMPVPAFQVPAPYPYNNCGCGCGNGFGCGC